MKDVSTFIEEARAKGLDDAVILESLKENGWKESTAKLALAGLNVPAPNEEPTPNALGIAEETATLSPLGAALHHVILWFFTGSSTVTITGAIASLYGYDVSARALATMIAVTIIAFIPYAILYITYLIKERRRPGLIPGKVWSIITICLHSIGAMVAAIVAVVGLINDGEEAVTVGSLLVLLLNALVVITYSLAAFSRTHTFRRITIRLYPAVLAAMFGILFTLSLVNLGPARSDDELRRSLTKTVDAVVTYTQNNNQLPTNGSDVVQSDKIRYEKLSDKTYRVCATFQARNTSHSPYKDTAFPDDRFVYDTYFYADKAGEQCFAFTSSHLADTAIEEPFPTEKPQTNDSFDATIQNL